MAVIAGVAIAGRTRPDDRIIAIPAQDGSAIGNQKRGCVPPDAVSDGGNRSATLANELRAEYVGVPGASTGERHINVCMILNPALNCVEIARAEIAGGAIAKSCEV